MEVNSKTIVTFSPSLPLSLWKPPPSVGILQPHAFLVLRSLRPNSNHSRIAISILFLSVSVSSTISPNYSSSPKLIRQAVDQLEENMGGGQLISVHPEELTFEFELEKPSYCNLRVVNNTEHHVAFKVKTTSPKKYFVRPNTNVVQPWDSCTITVTLQAQKEYPPNMQCMDKFLLQSTKVPPTIDIDEIPPDTFSKHGEKVIEECKLKVVYITPQSAHTNSEGESGISSTSKLSGKGFEMAKNSIIEESQQVQRMREDMDTTLQQYKQLQRELELLKSRRNSQTDAGFSLTFAAIAGLIGLLIGIMLKLALSSPSAE